MLLEEKILNLTPQRILWMLLKRFSRIKFTLASTVYTEINQIFNALNDCYVNRCYIYLITSDDCVYQQLLLGWYLIVNFFRLHNDWVSFRYGYLQYMRFLFQSFHLYSGFFLNFIRKNFCVKKVTSVSLSESLL